MFKTIVKNIVNWIVQSSENPSQMALTVKGIIVMMIPWIVTVLGIFHVSVASADVATLGNSIIVILQSLMTAIGAGMFVYGFIRKIINSAFIPWPTDPTIVAEMGAPNTVIPSAKVNSNSLV